MNLACSATELQTIQDLLNIVDGTLGDMRDECKVIFCHELARVYRKPIRSWQKEQPKMVKTWASKMFDGLIDGKPKGS